MRETSNQNSFCVSHLPVSVIICTTGTRLGLLDRCLDSVLAQDCARAEILVVLNGEWQDKIAHQIMRYPVRLLHQPVRGVNRARNTALREAKGEIIVCADDDVVAFPDWLHNLIQGFNDPRVACVTGRVVPAGLTVEQIPKRYQELFMDRALTRWTYYPESDWYQKALGGWMRASFCNMGFRRIFLENYCRFPEDIGAGAAINCADDLFMILQVLKNGFGIHHPPDAVVSHYFDSDITQQKERLWQLRAGTVALYLKLLREDEKYRCVILQHVVSLAMRIARNRSQESKPGKGLELLSTTERLDAYFQGVRTFWRMEK